MIPTFCAPGEYNILLRLVEGDEDIAASRRGGGGKQRTLSEKDDILVGLLACEGYSQRAVTKLINADRTAARGCDQLVDRKQIRARG